MELKSDDEKHRAGTTSINDKLSEVRQWRLCAEWFTGREGKGACENRYRRDRKSSAAR